MSLSICTCMYVYIYIYHIWGMSNIPSPKGADVILPNGIPGLKPLSSTSPLLLLGRINKTNGVVTDVVKEPETPTTAASKKSLLQNKNLLNDIAGYIARKHPKAFPVYGIHCTFEWHF